LFSTTNHVAQWYNLSSMLTLAFETATETGSVCLYSDEKGLLAEVSIGPLKRHSQSLMLAVNFILTQAEMSVNDIDFFSISIGPGSFTGLRVGISTAKGLAFATCKPIAEVPTLEAMALSRVPEKRLICSMLDARKKEVYSAVFRWGSEGLKRILPETVCSVEDILKEIKKECVFLGSGAVMYKDRIISYMNNKASFVLQPMHIPLARCVGLLGILKAKQGLLKKASEVKPFYIRPSEAELKFKK